MATRQARLSSGIRPRRLRAVLAVGLCLPMCGGELDGSGGGGSGGSAANGSGGVSPVGADPGTLAGVGGVAGDGGAGVYLDAGAPPVAGAAGSEQEVYCWEGLLWDRVAEAAVGPLGTCAPMSFYAQYSSYPRYPWGAIVIDADGRVIDNTSFDSGYVRGKKQDWLDEIADESFPCLADQTIEFACDGFE